jgi:hypothetical protein
LQKKKKKTHTHAKCPPHATYIEYRQLLLLLLIEKNGGGLFRRPKLTLSCSAEGKEGLLLLLLLYYDKSALKVFKFPQLIHPTSF